MLTSGEVQQLLQAHGRPLPDIAEAPLDTIVPGVQDNPRLYGIPGGSGVLPMSQRGVSGTLHDKTWICCLTV